MKYHTVLSFAASLLSLTEALHLVKREGSAPAVIGADIQRRHVDDPISRDNQRRRKMKRSATLQESLDNLETLYFANASMGTPKQTLRLHIDTGSSDLWVNSASSSLCSEKMDPCSESGTYSANDSSTYNYLNSDFNISYVDGSGASGDYVTDNFYFGGYNLTDMEFGIGYTSSSSEGVLGVGYAVNEVAVNRAGLDAYPNLPQLLVNKGIINSNAYSLWLNDLEASTGSILFGGVDTDKYTGTLSTLPIIKEYGEYSEFIIALTGLGISGDEGSIFNSSDSSVPVLLDSGSSLMYLPDDYVSTIYDRFDATYDSSQGAAFVDCSLANEDASLDFTFSSPTISVSMSEMVIIAGYSRGEAICILGVSPAGDSTSVLGDTFLRSAYVVYDLDNNEISLASTNFNATSSNIMEITAGESGVPDATGVANAVSTAAGATGGARNGGITATGAAAPMKTAMPMGAAAMVAGAALFAL
ncbi:acid protease [Saccharata proteae CBS 121410]|uniref:Probable aspartic-type endopeptidase OPSB n=1 Tax=Saccharata proteae CBS 121410 TaxID=1314787 RepID=A0A9P4LW51_9PEZI|nr:acid protease [Saccharata proteae CBS 121410]